MTCNAGSLSVFGGDPPNTASVEETERYLHAERARYARAVDGLDTYVLP